MVFESKDVSSVFGDLVSDADCFVLEFEKCAESLFCEEDVLSHSYQITYPMIVRYFDLLSVMGKEDFVRGILMVYGWMPKILRVCSGGVLRDDEFLMIRSFLVKLRCLSGEEKLDGYKGFIEGEWIVNRLKVLMNNSVVGLSKLLHFVNPRAFPLLDSRILSLFLPYFRNKYGKNEKWGVGNINLEVRDYFNFLLGVVEYRNGLLASQKHDGEIALCIKDYSGKCNSLYGGYGNFDVSYLRAIDVLMFYLAKSK